VTALKKSTSIDRINSDGFARSAILLGLEQKIEVDYVVISDAQRLWEKPT